MFETKWVRWALVGLVATVAAILDGNHAARAQRLDTCSTSIDIAATLRGAREDPDVRKIDADIDSIFRSTLAELRSSPPADRYHRIMLLGKLELYDENLSVRRNIACATCHVESTGYTGGVDLYNRTIVAQPGSVPITNATGREPTWRIAKRKPQTYGYAPMSPILHLNAAQDDFFGGNFWDKRATGLLLGNPAAAQAQGPPLDALEMAFGDKACVVRRLSQAPYRSLFEEIWGPQSFAIQWPADVDEVCSRPGPAPAGTPGPVKLDPVQRGIADQTYNAFALAIATFEAGPEVSPFSSKFDYALAHPDEKILSPDELAGWEIFRTRGKCNTCHVDGTENPAGRGAAGGRAITPADAADAAPLFTDFTSANLGVPRNLALPFYCENRPDQYGYVANPAGLAFIDLGVGGFLQGAQNPNPEWAGKAREFDGAFAVPTLRNVDMRPRPDFVKAYLHNGYLKSLEEVVHFYNTRDKLPRCPQGSPGEKVTCWPPPEVAANVDRTVGNLGLTDREEAQIVAFLRTLTDGYRP